MDRCGEELERILRAPNPELYYGLPIKYNYCQFLQLLNFFSVLELSDWNEEAGEDCLSAPIPFSVALSRAIQSACTSFCSRNAQLIGKLNITPRFWCLPCTPWTFFERLPEAKSVHRLVSLRGTVIRVSAVRMQELHREFECQKCAQRLMLKADDWNGGAIGKPVLCPAEVDGLPCRGTKFTGKLTVQ